MSTADIVLKGIGGAATTAALVCLAVYTLLAYREDARPLLRIYKESASSFLARCFLIVCLIAFVVCIYQGADWMLQWMPDSWGSLDEDGEYVTLRHSIAFVFAFFFGGMLAQVIGRATDAAEKNEQLSRRIRRLEQLLRDEDWRAARG